MKLSKHLHLYQVVGYTSEGKFAIALIDEGDLRVIKTELATTQTCFDIDLDENVDVLGYQQQITLQIKNYLSEKYDLSEYTLSFVQVIRKET